MPRTTEPSHRKLWLARMLRFRQSGLGVSQFCLREGVSQPTFYKWKKRLGSDPSVEHGEASKFVPVMVTDEATPATPTLRLPGGVCVELPCTLERGQLTNLVAACLAAAQGDGEVAG